jgi:Plasmid pRiA4b ORF-3-like protein
MLMETSIAIFDMEDALSEKQVKLNQILTTVKDKFDYEYDFGDCWDHQIVLEQILPPEPKTHYPLCLTGKSHCPPEDVGGIWGYENFLKAIADKNHPDHSMLTEWVGEPFDPKEFDLANINKGLARI